MDIFTPKIPDLPPPPPPTPMMDEEAVRRARRDAAAKGRAKRGRVSTLLDDESTP